MWKLKRTICDWGVWTKSLLVPWTWVWFVNQLRAFNHSTVPDGRLTLGRWSKTSILSARNVIASTCDSNYKMKLAEFVEIDTSWTYITNFRLIITHSNHQDCVRLSYTPLCPWWHLIISLIEDNSMRIFTGRQPVGQTVFVWTKWTNGQIAAWKWTTNLSNAFNPSLLTTIVLSNLKTFEQICDRACCSSIENFCRGTSRDEGRIATVDKLAKWLDTSP